jgi:GNAT superfamily N-acetyltransferase
MIEVAPVHGAELIEPVKLREKSLRDGEPVPDEFAAALRETVKAGELEVLVARAEGHMVGVAVLAYRLNIVAGLFASIEDRYVRPDERRQDICRALLEVVEERCASRDVSYVEAQVEYGEAAAFYAALGYEPQSGVQVLSRSYAL